MKTGWGISDRQRKLWNPLMPINSLQSELPRNLSLSHSVELINLSQDTSITSKNQELHITKNTRKFSSPKMRPAPLETAEAADISHLSPPPPLPSRPPSCDPQVHSCKWWPYSNSNDAGANTATILMILLCALICALAFNTAIRWFLRSDNDSSSDHLRELEEQRKPNKESDMASLVLATTQVYYAGMKLAGAEADCAICLSEFVEGEGIRVLGRCNHGFHVHCVEKWLASHSSCPTCRCSCLASSLSSPEPANCCARNGLDNNSSQSAEPERAPANLSANENIPV
jgi:E3 ubiquitin-protein ligase ATL10/75/76/77/78